MVQSSKWNLKVKVIWPDGSTEEKPLNQMVGLQKRRDNGSTVRPMALILVPEPIPHVFSPVDWKIFKTTLIKYQVCLPPDFLDRVSYEEDIPEEYNLPTTQMKTRIARIKEDIRYLQDEITMYEETK